MAEKQVESDKSKTSGLEKQELDDLQDSALNDFSAQAEKSSAAGQGSSDTKSESSGQLDAPDAIWNAEFLAKVQEQKLEELFDTDDDTDLESFRNFVWDCQKMDEAFKVMLRDGIAPDMSGKSDEYAKMITETIKGEQSIPEELPEFFDKLKVEGGEGDVNPFMPFMQGMLQTVLSAETILPIIKDLLEKYSKYLEENGDKIDAKDKERYIKQKELCQVISDELETESPTDSIEVSQKRLKSVLDNWRKLLGYGQPSTELIGENGFDLPLVPGGLGGPPGAMPGMPPGPGEPNELCSIM